jgi:hypothetical protein
MYTFLMSAARFPSSHVQDICVEYLTLVDDEVNFPTDLNAVYEEMISVTDVINQVVNRNRSKQTHEGSVHQTSSRNVSHNIRKFHEKKGDSHSKKGFQTKGVVNSAYSNINKSVRSKLETQSLSGKPKNVHTEKAYQEAKRTRPNLTYKEFLNELRNCILCGGKWHVKEDCRKNSNGSSTPKQYSKPYPKPKQNGPSKTFRKKFTKGKVNNTVGRSVTLYGDDGIDGDDNDWVGSVFTIYGEIIPCDNCVAIYQPNDSNSDMSRVTFGSDEEIENANILTDLMMMLLTTWKNSIIP